jgi:hypothetical protein
MCGRPSAGRAGRDRPGVPAGPFPADRSTSGDLRQVVVGRDRQLLVQAHHDPSQPLGPNPSARTRRPRPAGPDPPAQPLGPNPPVPTRRPDHSARTHRSRPAGPTTRPEPTGPDPPAQPHGPNPPVPTHRPNPPRPVPTHHVRFPAHWPQPTTSVGVARAGSPGHHNEARTKASRGRSRRLGDCDGLQVRHTPPRGGAEFGDAAPRTGPAPLTNQRHATDARLTRERSAADRPG